MESDIIYSNVITYIYIYMKMFKHLGRCLNIFTASCVCLETCSPEEEINTSRYL